MGPNFLLGITYLLSVILLNVNCQYAEQMKEQVPMDGYGSYGGAHYDTGSYDPEPEVDERPKINLGIRLKIPAIKFELPRFNMPKITVSAKIRQPDRPRVISLPEINLDTHSSAAANNAAAGRSYAKSTGGYSAGGNKPKVNQQEQEQTLTFSTQTDSKPSQEEERPPQYQNYHKSSYPNYNLRSSYSSYNQPQPQFISQLPVPAYASSHQYHQLATSAGSTSSASSDLGFEAPIYVQPKHSGEPIEAYGRRPVRVMSYMGNPDNFRNHNFPSAQEVFVDTRSLRNGYFV